MSDFIELMQVELVANGVVASSARRCIINTQHIVSVFEGSHDTSTVNLIDGGPAFAVNHTYDQIKQILDL